MANTPDVTVNVSAEDPIFKPGYFRIGFVVLKIPPIDITTNKVVNDDQVSTIRTVSPMFVKTGQARYDVTVHWKALVILDKNGVPDYSQLSDVRNVVAMFRAAPFVEVENAYLRQVFTDISEVYTNGRMAFGLRQIRIDIDPSSVDALDVTLTMSLFNFAPYSIDFAYNDGNGGKVDASNSPGFQSFILNWVQQNMDVAQGRNNPAIRAWQDQEDGVVSFKWRKYLFMPFQIGPPSPATSPGSVATQTPTTSVPLAPTSNVVSPSLNKISDNIKTIITTAAKANNVDTNIAYALCLEESGGNPNIQSSSSSAQGLFQLLVGTAPNINRLDPTQNANFAMKLVGQYYKQFGSYPLALAAFNQGPGAVIAYRDGTTFVDKSNGLTVNPQQLKTGGIPPAATKYVSTILSWAGQSNLLNQVTTATGTIAPLTPAITIAIPDPNITKLLEQSIAALPAVDQPWFLDHYTSLGAFFYTEQQTTLAPSDADTASDFRMFPSQVSIAMVNNLAQIPLAAYQYPTYQHVGPPDTMVSIAMTSLGDASSIFNEPEHGGIQALTVMSSVLEEQFTRLKNTWRAVSSIHRMQAVFIENRLLNMFGITGTMIRGITTETVPGSADAQSVQIMASKYDNIFEETSPFRVNGVSSAYQPLVAGTVKSGVINNLSTQEQNAYAAVQEFGNKWSAHDKTYAATTILSLMTQAGNDILGSMSSVQAVTISGPDRSLLLSQIYNNVSQSSVTMAASVVTGVNLSALTGDTAAYQKWPGLQLRVNELTGNYNPITYADYLVLSTLPVTNQSQNSTQLQTIITSVEKQVSAQLSTIMESIYMILFDWEMRSNPLFSRQLTSLINSPILAPIFNSVIDPSGPGLNGENANHGCYRDLGITNIRQEPADYFYNYNADLNTEFGKEMLSAIGSASDVAQQANAPQGSQGTFSFIGDNSAVLSPTQIVNGGANAITKSSVVPTYNMAQAFPTYKLFLIEEDNSGPFYCFDNFYSYASILDIEVIRYQDKPDQAIIKISNLAHLLSHRLYDDTAEGKIEYRDNTSLNTSGLSNTGEILAGPTGTRQVASKTIGGIPVQSIPNPNLVEGFAEGRNRIPLKFYALQTGSKIQVRLGYSNNPDNLFPVFTGQVTEISGDEILTIVCQSFMLELMEVPGSAVIADSYFSMNAFILNNSAFGNISLSNGGDTGSVLSKLITAATARHFGKWQINSDVDPMLKGFSWKNLLAQTAGAIATSVGSTVIGALLQTGYDRSGENILINDIINYDGTQSGLTTSLYDELPLWGILSAHYNIPKKSTMSLWEIMKDVSRRRPEYNLMVKQYGFPYGADATLVYSHPLGYYYTRAPLLGDAEKEAPNNNTQQQIFQAWWNSTGKTKMTEAFSLATSFTTNTSAASAMQLALTQMGGTDKILQVAGQGPEQFTDVISYFHALINGDVATLEMSKLSPHQMVDNPTTAVDIAIGLFYSLVDQIPLLTAQTSGSAGGVLAQIDRDFQDLNSEWLVYLGTSDPGASTGRRQPARKYHFVSHADIIHNDISINDKIYNCVSIDNTVYTVNQNIPAQHQRVLVVDDLINDPSDNVYGIGNTSIQTAYAQSFLKEEVGKMYRGELIIRGTPEIEPFDVVIMMDLSTGVIGPIEVDTVIHSFTVEDGYITIIKPKLLMIVNESSTANVIRSIGYTIANAMSTINSVKQVFSPATKSIATTGAVQGIDSSVQNTTATIQTLAVANPQIAALLGGLGLLSGIGLLYLDQVVNKKHNLFKMMPLSKFGRPWLGGVQGFQLADFVWSLANSWQRFDAEEIKPVIESWHTFLNYKADYFTNVTY